MKTIIPLTLAVALTAITLNVSASDPLLSPRAAGNQPKVVKGTANSPNTLTQNRNLTVAPRTLDNQVKTVQGMDTSPNTMAGGCALGSPRQLEQAGKFSSGDCCKVISVPCSSPKSCCTVAGQ